MTTLRTIHVRAAEADDVARVAPLFDAYRGFYGKPSDVAAARAFLEARLARRESVLLVAVADGEAVVGFAHLYPSFSSLRLARTFVLNDLFVAEGARRRGVAGRLLDAVASHARDAGAAYVELSTQRSNAAALGLYRAHGYVPDTEFAHLCLDLAPRDR